MLGHGESSPLLLCCVDSGILVVVLVLMSRIVRRGGIHGLGGAEGAEWLKIAATEREAVGTAVTTAAAGEQVCTASRGFHPLALAMTI
jgi:hypothetical protein